MRVLVIGGTGFVGKPLVRHIAKKHEVILFGREDDIDRPDSAKMITGNVADRVSLRKAFSGKIDVVYHLAASMDEDDKDMWKTNVLGTENVVRVCKEKKVKQLVFMSTAGVLGEKTYPAKENEHYNPKTRFDKTKMEAEKIVRNSGLNYTIVRAPVIMGPNVMWYRIFNAIKQGHPLIGHGKNKFHVVHVSDVVRLLLKVVGNQNAIGHIFHVASKDLMTYEEVYTTICKDLKIRGRRYKQPERRARILSKLHSIKMAAKVRPEHHHMTKHHINMVTRNYALSIRKAKELLDFEPQYTTPAAIHETFMEIEYPSFGYE